MTPKKLDLYVATFSYGGNGSTRSEVPDVRDYIVKMQRQWLDEPRLGRVAMGEFGDTPVTLCRNNAVCTARENGFDLLLMIDSDMWPDVELGSDEDAKPFWDEAFEFIYSRWDRGPNVVAAPYCGPPPNENVYSFHWANCQSDHPDDMDLQLVQYTRYEASELSGVQEVAALPTGLILYDVRVFELTEPRKKGDRPWFYYEYTDMYERRKGSTEDVTQTRDLSLAGMAKLGYNPVHCAWSSWAGHWKPKCVRKPRLLRPDMVGESFKRAVTEGRVESNRKRMVVDFTANLPECPYGSDRWAIATRE